MTRSKVSSQITTAQIATIQNCFSKLQLVEIIFAIARMTLTSYLTSQTIRLEKNFLVPKEPTS
jgi:hypothetical protein